MNGIATIPTNGRPVAQNPRDVLRLVDALRDEAALELAEALDGASVKKVKAANVPGAGATYLSRAQNGDSCNPVYRLGAVFVLGRVLGVPKWRFQRLLDWLQQVLDQAYDDAPAPTLDEVLSEDSELDPKDDHLRFLAAQGCADARRELIDVKRRQMALAPTVIFALQRG